MKFVKILHVISQSPRWHRPELTPHKHIQSENTENSEISENA